MLEAGNKISHALQGLWWIHVDVFSNTPLQGNGLAVFPEAQHLSSDQMLALTQELRQFETIFLCGPTDGSDVRARIFTMEEELDFAGHPILGAATVLHYLNNSKADGLWQFALNKSKVSTCTATRPHGFWAEMNQGIPFFEPLPSASAVSPILSGLGLEHSDLADELPLATVSTGLPYVIVPVTSDGLTRAQVTCDDFEQRLEQLGGKFVYVLDPVTCEGRTWDNLGLVEDIATGSAAGPAAAYLQRYCGAPDHVTLHQGRFVDRASKISVTCNPQTGAIKVSGDVVIVAEGRFL